MNENKIALIYDHDDINKGFTDGQIEFYGNMEQDSLHIAYLLDYARSKFPEIPIFQQLTLRHQPEVAAYFLTRLGMIVFLNMTKYDPEHLKKYGKMGMLMLPDQMTPAQIESLKQFVADIQDFDISIHYNLSIDMGMLDAKTIIGLNHETPMELMNLYFERVSEKNRNI